MAQDFHLDAVLYPDEGGWLAHCLQLDLAEWGETPEGAYQSLLEVVRVHVEAAFHNDNLDFLFHSAPPEVWKRFSQAQVFHETPLALNLPDDVLLRGRVRESRTAA